MNDNFADAAAAAPDTVAGKGHTCQEDGIISVSPATEPVREWIEEVSAGAGIPVAEVGSILDRYNIAPARALPPRRRLSLNAVHFAGMKDLAVDGHQDLRQLVPFSFTHEFAPGLTAFGTRNVNDAGKTSLLEVVIWSLRGRCNLQGDVRQWINQASVEVTLAGDRILIGWTVTNGRPRGRVLLLDDTHSIDWPDVDKGALAHFRAQADDRDSRRAEHQGSQTGIRSDHETIGWTPLQRLNCQDCHSR